jgi:hypothetical protein
MTEGMRSGELGSAAGVNPQTLRYYERRGLLAALDAGCDDLSACASSPHCPLPFAELAEAGRPGGPSAAGR